MKACLLITQSKIYNAQLVNLALNFTLALKRLNTTMKNIAMRRATTQSRCQSRLNADLKTISTDHPPNWPQVISRAP